MSYQSRAWCFTINNPVRNDIPAIWYLEKEVDYIIWQREIGENGTPHLQGYFITKVNPKSKAGFTLKWCKENLNGKAHFEMRKGTHKEAVDYCKKDRSRAPGISGPWEHGTWKDQETTRAEAGERAKKVNLLDIKAAIDAGATDKQLWDTNFRQMAQYNNAFTKYRLAMGAGKRKQPAIMCFWGEPGCGKSMRARDIAAKYGEAFWWNADNGNWFDLYDNSRHKVVVLDEFNGTIKYTTLLRMLDAYPLQLEVKGGMVAFNPDVIIITSNKPPNQWYFQDNINFDHGAILRRLSAPFGKTIEMKKTIGYVQPQALPAFDFDAIENGTFLDHEKDVREMYLGDVSKQESHKATIDLTADEDEDVEDKVAIPIGAQPTDLERDFDEDFSRYSPPPSQAVSTLSALGRTDAASLAFNTPLNKPGTFKKLGHEPVQSVLSFRAAPRVSAISEAEARQLQFVNQDDFDADFPPEPAPKRTRRRGAAPIKVAVSHDDDGDD